MQRTRIVETEISVGGNAAAAKSISNATCVRLHNDTSGIATVAISTSVGAATTTYFTMPAYSVEFLEKLPSDVIWSSPQIKATKVAFTN